MKQPRSCCMYCSFKSDWLRLVASVSRDIRILLVSLTGAIAASPIAAEIGKRVLAYVTSATA